MLRVLVLGSTAGEKGVKGREEEKKKQAKMFVPSVRGNGSAKADAGNLERRI